MAKKFIPTPIEAVRRYIGNPCLKLIQQGKIPSTVACTLLHGLLPTELFPVITAHYGAGGNLLGKDYTTADRIRLCLRPFADLVTRQPDGTTPACEVYAMTGRSREVAVLAQLMDNGSIMLTYAKGGHNFINPDFLNGEYLSARAAEYLCRLGFAVGLKPEEYEELPATAVAREEVAVG